MKRILLKTIIFLLITIITFIYTIKWLTSYDIVMDNETVDLLLESSGNIKSKNRVITKVVDTIKNTDLINPVSIIIDKPKEENEVLVLNELKKEEKVDIQPINEEKPIIYIYNTHQGEKYASNKEININYSVMDASFYLQKVLKSKNINSIVETLSVSDVLNTNNWNYATSYRVSRMFMEKRKKENNSLTYFIDLHRDSVNKKISTITINGKNYARTMFLLGLENPNYKKNKIILDKLERYLNNNYKGLSRGIYEKQGKKVNGIYNQDFSENCILIEIGGEENSFVEVENTIDVIANMLELYIGGKIE